MISTRRHIAPIFLIGILCLPALLFLYLELHQKIVQHEMVEKLEHAELQTIVLHKNAVRWYKKNKEIIVNSTLFDVHRYYVRKDAIVFTGLFDFKETGLKEQVKKLLEQRNEKSTPRELIIAKLILQWWVAGNGNLHVSVSTAAIENKKPIFSTRNLLFADIPVPSPPPRT